MYVAYDRPGRHEAFARCWYSVGPQSAAQDRVDVYDIFVVMTMGAIAQ